MEIIDFLLDLWEWIKYTVVDSFIGEMIPFIPSSLSTFLNIADIIDNSVFYIKLLYFIYVVAYIILLIIRSRRLNVVVCAIFGIYRIPMIANSLTEFRKVTIGLDLLESIFLIPLNFGAFILYCCACLGSELWLAIQVTGRRCNICIVFLANIALSLFWYLLSIIFIKFI